MSKKKPPSYRRKRQCRSKVQHASEAEARQAAQEVAAKGWLRGPDQVVYHCELCGFWHWSSHDVIPDDTPKERLNRPLVWRPKANGLSLSAPEKRYERLSAFARQGGICFYCEEPVWMEGFETKVDASRRLGLSGASAVALDERACTLGRLDLEVDGVLYDSHFNFIACCATCVTTRGTRSVEEHKALMMQRVGRG